MNWFHYLVVWRGRTCVEVRDFDTDSTACNKAADEMNEPMERGIIPDKTAQVYSVYPKDSLDIYVGYERDEKFRDEMDWSNDVAEDGDA